mmetsp:Transcript_160/g.209  ORF Transcript_160/g.209 Transcript_160/m.209 type:complete len:110 (+) Transcript_160:150-479(+)
MLENSSMMVANTLSGINNVGGELSLPNVSVKFDISQINGDNMSKEEKYLQLLQGYEYETLMVFDQKKQKEVPQYKCIKSNCGKMLPKLWNLLDHVRMHAGVKPFKCEWC